MTERQMTDIPSPGVSRTEACSLAAVRRVAAMLGLDPDAWQEGDPLPRGWQFILLGADTPRGALRGDGFPGLGVPLPDQYSNGKFHQGKISAQKTAATPIPQVISESGVRV
jgi:3-methylfumaryl-CoA hydratase